MRIKVSKMDRGSSIHNNKPQPKEKANLEAKPNDSTPEKSKKATDEFKDIKVPQSISEVTNTNNATSFPSDSSK